ncbi:hypothetical protein [Hymenobacter cheonanensis]|uniref:hypothetical protein n=1 Tax=Hymenobacter sp. CA2-7 TaxID=3063993 RepID=UPI0027128A63|nr:hypothetical protein [Hymenobacter sp. CA2-7]MDO7886703.1 hypothetical protein [Hymenobacter sp. CA2-7]
MKTLLLLALGLLLTTPTPAQRRPQAWRGFSGPAYLPRLPRRPSQHRLDSLASAARRRRALFTAK